MFRDQSRELRKKAQAELIGNRAEAGQNFINEAAALEQADELLAKKDDKAEDQKPDRAGALAAATTIHEGPSVTYHLRSRLTVPSRNDQQLIEVARHRDQARVLLQGRARADLARLSAGGPREQERVCAAAGRGDDVRRLRLRRPDEPAVGRHRRALHGRLRRRPAASGLRGSW